LADQETLRLAHLTDVHLGPLPRFAPRHWNVKRLMGYVNFRTKRGAFHLAKLAQAVSEDVKAQGVDHITVTGDLVNLGMPSEFERAQSWLQDLGSPDDVTVIPGNHDIYTRLRRDIGVERWRAYMSARFGGDDVAGVPGPLVTGFPFVRMLGRFAMIALNSAVYTPPGFCSGALGTAQIERFGEMSAALGAAGFTRIVLLHHPPLVEHGRRRGITDAAAFERALTSVGAELVLHGHNHHHMLSWRETATGPVAIIGGPSAGEGYYNTYDLTRQDAGRLAIERITRGLEDGAQAVRELERQRVSFMQK
jgi:3',5'-cyclic AMP phosphodiesterase CpdA